MQRFICFIRGGIPNPEHQQEDIKSLTTWIAKLANEGIITDSGILTTTGKISSKNGTIVKDFVFDRNDNVSCFLIIKSQNLDQAIQLTSDCPVFLYDGNITIRSIEET
jgi:hypothetical protein